MYPQNCLVQIDLYNLNWRKNYTYIFDNSTSFDCTDIFNFTTNDYQDEISCMYCFAAKRKDDKNNNTYARFYLYNMTEDLIYALSNNTIDMYVNPFAFTRQCKATNLTNFEICFPNQAYINETLTPSLNYYEVKEPKKVTPGASKIFLSILFGGMIIGFIILFTVQLVKYVRLKRQKYWVQEDAREVEEQVVN